MAYQERSLREPLAFMVFGKPIQDRGRPDQEKGHGEVKQPGHYAAHGACTEA